MCVGGKASAIEIPPPPLSKRRATSLFEAPRQIHGDSLIEILWVWPWVYALFAPSCSSRLVTQGPCSPRPRRATTHFDMKGRTRRKDRGPISEAVTFKREPKPIFLLPPRPPPFHRWTTSGRQQQAERTSRATTGLPRRATRVACLASMRRLGSLSGHSLNSDTRRTRRTRTHTHTRDRYMCPVLPSFPLGGLTPYPSPPIHTHTHTQTRSMEHGTPPVFLILGYSSGLGPRIDQCAGEVLL